MREHRGRLLLYLSGSHSFGLRLLLTLDKQNVLKLCQIRLQTMMTMLHCDDFEKLMCRNSMIIMT